MYQPEQEPQSSTKVETKSTWRDSVSNLSGVQLALIGIALLAAVVVLGIWAGSNNESAPPTDAQLLEIVQTQQDQYVALLRASPDGQAAAQQAVEDSPAGMQGYERFLDRQLEAETSALELARTDGMASPAAVQQIQQNIEDVSAEQTRVAAQ